MDNLLSYIPFSSSLSEEEGKEVLNNIKSGSGRGSKRLAAIVDHIGFLGNPSKTETFGNYKGIPQSFFGRSGYFLELLHLLRVEDMDFPLEPAKAAIFPKRIDKAVPINGSGLQTDYHTLKLHGAQCRHDSL